METILNKESRAAIELMVADGIIAKDTAERYFPELKESDNERIRQFLIHEVTETSDEIMFYRNMNKKDVLAWLEKQGEQKPIEEYNITGIGSKNAKGKLGEMIKNLKSVNEVLEQKLTWSEEDEDNLNSAIYYIRREPYRECDVEPIVDWLKNKLSSLRPQSTWKPSDEQIKALANALSLAKNCGEESAFDLRTLYEQIKKLREE